jgi:phosphomannomutase
MRKKDAVFASELSGHYYFKQNFYTESSSLATIYILNLLSNTEEKISEIVKKLKKFYKIPETNFKVENKQKILEKIEIKYSSFN